MASSCLGQNALCDIVLLNRGNSKAQEKRNRHANNRRRFKRKNRLRESQCLDPDRGSKNREAQRQAKARRSANDRTPRGETSPEDRQDEQREGRTCRYSKG